VHNLSVRRFVTGLVTAVALATASSLNAQNAQFATPFLPDDHWAVDAARRASVLGLASAEFSWGDGSLTQAAAGQALHDATKRTRAISPNLQRAMDANWQRFAREFPAVALRVAPDDSTPNRLRRPAAVSSSMSAGVVSANGRLLPVRSLDRTRENVSPPEAVADRTDGAVEARIGALGTRFFAAEVAGGRRDSEWQVHDWQAIASAGPLGAWVGRRTPAFGPGGGGGLVFDGQSAFSGGGIALTNAVTLPWLFRVFGPLRAEAFLSRMDSSASTRHPWMFASHASITPHPRLLLGATQAFMFSGSGLPPFTWRNFKEMFLTHGIKVAGSEFENGIASVEARWRPPLPKLPAVLYAEWATDDNKSAWFKFPAVVAGVELPSLPMAPAVSLGLERTSFSAPCSDCNGCACEYYATWYRHYVFMDGWTVDRQPIGHPLGGAGTEWLLYGRLDHAARGLRLDGHAFARDRGRFNLYAPTREGRSVGGRASAQYRLTPAVELRSAVELEQGQGDWTAWSLSAGLRWVP
jgi:hypothetical protein